MPKVTIDRERCKGCELCVAACPKQVLAMSTKINSKGYFYAEVAHIENCIACALCAKSCPDAAIEVER
ncbi:MAG: 2-oxoacid:acceptor oxidoreductase [Candidatus Coatesbacteria bacterium]|nr:MAG: 2-oxoacid:acceptor oxidoreductase [Candidatus Coatesbacteria bacterium]